MKALDALLKTSRKLAESRKDDMKRIALLEARLALYEEHIRNMHSTISALIPVVNTIRDTVADVIPTINNTRALVLEREKDWEKYYQLRRQKRRPTWKACYPSTAAIRARVAEFRAANLTPVVTPSK
jgi:hypothetical protein